MANTFGNLFRVTTWGESHGGGVGVVVDGCPPRLALTEADIQPDLDRRRPGQSKIVTPRKEADRVEILSGTFEGKTLEGAGEDFDAVGFFARRNNFGLAGAPTVEIGLNVRFGERQARGASVHDNAYSA